MEISFRKHLSIIYLLYKIFLQSTIIDISLKPKPSEIFDECKLLVYSIISSKLQSKKENWDSE